MISVSSYLRTTMLVLGMVIISLDGTGRQDNKGNPLPHFLLPQFKEGIVIMKDGNKFTTLLNYNMVDEKMITEVDGIYRYSKNPKNIERIYLDNRMFIPIDNVFYEILASGNASFFLQNKSSLTPKANDIGYGSKSHSTGPTKMTRYELTPVVYQYGEVINIDLPQNVDITPASVYWVSVGDKMKQFNTEKQLLKLFPEYETQIKDYIKKENIKMKNREDVIKLGIYCNEIMKGK
jgi:hypothetical protein